MESALYLAIVGIKACGLSKSDGSVIQLPQLLMRTRLAEPGLHMAWGSA